MRDHKIQAPEATPQLAVTGDVKAQDLQGDKQAGSYSVLPQQPMQMPSGSSEQPLGGSHTQSQAQTALPMSAAELCHKQALSPCSTDLVLAKQTCCPSDPAQQAQQHRHATLLIERAKALQCQVDQLGAEAQQAAPRTVEQLQQEAQQRATQQLIQRLPPQQCCTLAPRAQRLVQVPVRLDEAQAATVTHRCQGMAVRDYAMPLQNGFMMGPEARPCMAPLRDLQTAAACQQVVVAAGSCEPCAMLLARYHVKCLQPAVMPTPTPQCSLCTHPTAVTHTCFQS